MIATLAAAAALFAASAAGPPPVKIFVLAGQSNMAGYGELPATPLVAPRTFEISGGVLEPAVEPIGDAPGVGPAMSFAGELTRQDSNARVAFVQCAMGGTPLAAWLPGGGSWESCIEKTLAARKLGTIAGLLFHQGETDAGSFEAAASWKPRFELLVRLFRARVNAPQLTVVFGELGAPPATAAPPYWRLVQRQQQQVRLARTTMVKTVDLPTGGTQHFTVPGYRALGVRYARAWLKMLPR